MELGAHFKTLEFVNKNTDGNVVSLCYTMNSKILSHQGILKLEQICISRKFTKTNVSFNDCLRGVRTRHSFMSSLRFFFATQTTRSITRVANIDALYNRNRF